MKRALVCGAGGFIAGHRLGQGDKETGRQGASRFTLSPPLPLSLSQLGGMGFISVAECEVLRNNALINIHMAHAAEMGVARYFFSSSVCVYRDMGRDEPALTEDDAIPAEPDNEYGWGVGLRRSPVPIATRRIARTYPWIEAQVGESSGEKRNQSYE